MKQILSSDRLYLKDDYCFENTGTVVAVHENMVALQSDNEGDVLWHVCSKVPHANGIDKQVHLILNNWISANLQFFIRTTRKEQQALLCAHHPGMTLHVDQLLQES